MYRVEYNALKERAEDAIGDASCCSDDDCRCHIIAAELRNELEDIEPACFICGEPITPDEEPIPVYADAAGAEQIGRIHGSVDCAEGQP